MNIYDFDKTIYHGDSSLHFWRYCIKRNPLILVVLPIQAWNALRFSLKLTDDKSGLFSFVRFFKDEKIISDFWDKHEKNLCTWYLKQCKSTDVIISASPYFLIKEAAKRLGVDCIATNVDFKTGKCLDKNCKGEQKIVFFQEKYPNAKVEKAYGDSESDSFMMSLADESYFVENISVKGVRMYRK
jgi:phosphoserine phosphatase